MFITLSSAEYQWEGLLKSVFETVNGRPATDEDIQSMSSSERNKLITENVVQTTIHFQKRIEKIVRKLMEKGYLEDGEELNAQSEPNLDPDSSNASYFYRIEFQARGKYDVIFSFK